MVGVTTLATLAIAGIASLFMAWAIGAGSSGSTPFAPAVGANAISIMRAGFVVGLLGFLGAVLQGYGVSQTVGSGLVSFPNGGGFTPLAATIALATAGALVAIGVFTGYPIATAFTVTGAVVGVGLAFGGQPAVPKYVQIVTLWVLTPFVGGGAAYLTAVLLRDERAPESVLVPVLGGVVGAIIANISFAVLGTHGTPASIAQRGAQLLSLSSVAGYDVGQLVTTLVIAVVAGGALARDMSGDPDRGQRHFLLTLGALVAFSAGGSQVGLAIGPLFPLLGPSTGVVVPIAVILAFGGIGLLVGSWTGAPRMIKALAQDYSSLGPRRSIAALIPSFAIAQVAVALGVPVSFNEIIVSAIIGSGFAAGGAGVSRKKMLYTVLAWAGSLALALGLGYGVFSVVEML